MISWVCLKIGYARKNCTCMREHDAYHVDFGVPFSREIIFLGQESWKSAGVCPVLPASKAAVMGE